MNASSQAPSPALVRVLFVGDNPSDHRLIVDLLDSVPTTRFLIEWARNLSDALARLDKARFDICLLDTPLSDGDSLDVLSSADARGLMLPIIVLSPTPSAKEDQRALKLGAAAYLETFKLDPITLERAIRYAIHQQSVMSGLARHAFRDEESGLISRALYLERLDQALGFARRRDREVAVMMVDLAFKERGDETGGETDDDLIDKAIVEISRRLTDDLRETDSIGRLSDRRMALLIEGAQSLDHVSTVARKVLRRLRNPVSVENETVALVPSVGIAIYPREGGDGGTILRQAEAAMRRSITEGGGTCRFSSEQVDCEAREGMILEKAFNIAFEHRELRLGFRPEVELAGKRTGLVGEVFWRHPDRGWLPLSAIKAPLDDEILIKGLARWSLACAARQLSLWDEAGLRVQKLALALPFRHPPALACLREAAQDDVAPQNVALDRIELDLQEDLIIDDIRRSGSDLASLKATGIRLALDDFGQGRLAMRDFNHHAFDSLKLAKSLCQGLANDSRDEALVRALINFGHGLDLKVTAKGASDQGQFGLLKRLSCDAVQLSTAPAMNADAATTWLRAISQRPVIDKETRRNAPEFLAPRKPPLRQGERKAIPPTTGD